MKYGQVTLGRVEAVLNKLGGEDGIDRFLRGELVVMVKEAELLKRVEIATVSGAKEFVASEHLKEANVGWMDDNFKKLFLKKVEENIKDATIGVYRLERESLSIPIIAELGNHAEIQLAHLFELLKAQSIGQNGYLFTYFDNIAHVRGSDGDLRTVSVCWSLTSKFWVVRALSVESRDRWNEGRRVLSRES